MLSRSSVAGAGNAGCMEGSWAGGWRGGRLVPILHPCRPVRTVAGPWSLGCQPVCVRADDRLKAAHTAPNHRWCTVAGRVSPSRTAGTLALVAACFVLVLRPALKVVDS